MTAFNPSAIPLTDVHLIEASAGTGKTHSLADLHLRFLLERHDVDISQILVATYTNAAASELRDRLRSRIAAALDRLRKGEAADDRILAAALSRGSDERAMAIRIEAALASYDCAPIGTLHAYCRRVLTERMFECDMLAFGDVAAPSPDVNDRIVRAHLRSRPIAGDGPCFDSALRSLSMMNLRSVVRLACGADRLRIVPDASDAAPSTTAADREMSEAFESMRLLWPVHRSPALAALIESGVMNGNAYRPALVSSYFDALDRFFKDPVAMDKTWLEPLRKLGSSSVQKNVKKGKPPPESPLFEAAERLVDAMVSALDAAKQLAAFWMARMGIDAPRIRDALHDRLNLRTYDELVGLVREAIEGPDGAHLARTLAQDTPVVMVDEFQDTDPAQYAIVRALHNPGGATLVLIGDPKQSIYAFRGADIFAYKNASAAAVKHTLGENWRSTPGLVSAVNAVFRRPRAFVLDFIDMVEARPASRATVERLVRGGEEGAPLTLWKASPGERRPTIDKGVARSLLSDAVAAECVRLLDPSDGGSIHRSDGFRRPLRAGDLAVLVSTHAEGEMIRRSLGRAGIPCVASGPDSVLASFEAGELGVVLASLASPRDMGLLRAALLTRLMGWSPADVLSETPGPFDGLVRRWQEYHDLWRRSGFGVMFHHLTTRETVMERGLAASGGERCVTNLRHLGELIARAETERRMTPAAVVDWFDLERARDDVADESELRLESDADRVRIVTIHKSKGLQYPVVFCPFLWGLPRKLRQTFPVVCHDRDTGGDRVLDVGSEEFDLHARRQLAESFQESVRLAYVALTRARLACYTAWGPFKDAGSSALGWLFHGDPALQPGELILRIKEWNEAGIEADLVDLVNASDGGISVQPVPTRDEMRSPASGGRREDVLSARPATDGERRFHGAIEDGWRISSFSSLKASTHAAAERPDHDEFLSVPPMPAAGAKDAGARFSFPAGPGPGRYLHELLDGLDFSSADARRVRPKGAGLLPRHGIEPRWLDAAVSMALDTIHTPLNDEGMKLADLSENRCAHEMQFLFPVASLSPERLNEALGRMDDAGEDAPSRLVFDPFHGYLKGFIDLVFEANGRIYLLDYKSNHLGSSPDDYHPDRLAKVMADADYTLQAMIYSVALRHHAMARGESADGFYRRFGGVFYLFLRGLNPDDGPRQGVYHFRPPESDLIRLSAAFTNSACASCGRVGT